MADPRKSGKEFERLVEVLELLSATDARVEFDARVQDRFTLTARQIDVAVWVPTHHGELLIAIECKDHSRRVGVGIVEQVSQKGADIGADRLVIVSREGFTEEARAKARQLNIQLLRVTELDDDAWPEWVRMRSLICQLLHWEFSGPMMLYCQDRELDPDKLGSIQLKDPIVVRRDGSDISAREIVQLWFNGGAENELRQIASSTSRHIKGKLDVGDDRLVIHPDLDGESPEVTTITFEIDFKLVESEVPLRLMSYKQESGEQLAAAYVSDPVPIGDSMKRVILQFEEHPDGGGGNRVLMRIHEAS